MSSRPIANDSTANQEKNKHAQQQNENDELLSISKVVDCQRYSSSQFVKYRDSSRNNRSQIVSMQSKALLGQGNVNYRFVFFNVRLVERWKIILCEVVARDTGYRF
mmetsp:Transcript_611/g.899  ORF Transcript_611/g.899 Transcript_611/m.899 type:complete len:106 (+) Transcript_611:320-637(+)